MNKSTQTRISLMVLLSLFFSVVAIAQNQVRGTVKDAASGEPLIGASVLVKGTVVGTVTDVDGRFELRVREKTPYVLQISMVGMETKEVEVNEPDAVVDVTLSTQAIIGNEVVVSASRVEERLMESPVTIEKLDLTAIKQSSAPDYYDEIKALKGVRATNGSLTFTSYNTRGFAAIANVRFVQLMDGMDNAAPLLNFPTGNVVGISELDIANVELVPGAASALYGPNAFNGILLMNSKNPFDYPGLSAQMKAGLTQSTTSTHKDYNDPMGQVSVRWAQKVSDKFAYKLNFSVLQAKDWVADDYDTDRPTEGDGTVKPGDPNFDGLNLYGDETQIFLPFNAPQLNQPLSLALAQAFSQGDPIKFQIFKQLFPQLIAQADPIRITRTGLKEEDLLESRDAKSIKFSTALHYRLTDKLEASYSYRVGNGSTVYQGSERYALRNFVQQFHKLELTGPHFFLRAYQSGTDAGRSYNLTALGALTNEGFSPSASKWVPTYAGTYIGGALKLMLVDSLIPDLAHIPDAIKAQLHQVARLAADAGTPAPGTPEFNTIVERVRSSYFQRGGASFIDNSKLRHVEGNYDLSPLFGDAIGLQIGGNWRQYDLFTDGTVFNEDPEGTGVNHRIKINEVGGYVQVRKKMMDEKLKLTASLRYDKNDNFDGSFTPRLALVYSAGAKRQHNFRASFQTGFRNPSTQELYIYFPTTNILVGTAKKNAERYGLHNGRVWTKKSYDRAIAAQLAGDTTWMQYLQTIDLDYIRPERLMAFEVGYKGLPAEKLMADFNVYYNIYNDFISQINVVNMDTVYHKGQPIPPGQTFRPFYNVDSKITSYGIGLGLLYKLPNHFDLNGNVSYQDYSSNDENFEAGFNTPKIMFFLGLENHRLGKKKNLGFGINYKWQDAFYWQNSFGSGTVPAYGSLNGQVSYHIKSLGTTLKLGATNILKKEYRTNIGGPWIGRMIFLSLTYDDMSR